jgi:small subunit ribosomal protein S12e
MSDNEIEIVTPEVEEIVADLSTAIRKVLKIARSKDGLVRGIHEVVKALEAQKVKIVFLASSVNDANYKNLIEALAKEKNVPVVEVADNKTLGEWAGLCKIDQDGAARKVVGASCVAVTDFGGDSLALTFLKSQVNF